MKKGPLWHHWKLRNLWSFSGSNNELTCEKLNVLNDRAFSNAFLFKKHNFWDKIVTELSLIYNDLTGFVLVTFCDQNERRISVDDSIWFEDKSNVYCSCYNKGKCYIWDLEDDSTVPCPHKNLFSFAYDLSQKINDTVA